MNNDKLTLVQVKDAEDNAIGSGVLLSLENEEYDMVLTCAHCLDNMGELEKIKQSINLTAMFRNSNFTKTLKLQVVDVFVNIESDDRKYDVCVILVRKVVTKFNYICQTTSENINQTVSFAGFPGKAKNKCKDIEGTINLSIKNDGVNFEVHMKDEIFSNALISAKEIMDGFSGSPVFIIEDKIEKLIGIIKKYDSIRGEHLYNDVTAVKIEDVLELLWLKGYICYDIDKVSKIAKIIWRNNCDEVKKNILVIGGSGAGKSAFIKTFCKHKQFIDSDGDGQTTRIETIYQLTNNNCEPGLAITFQSASDFADRRTISNKTLLLELCYEIIGFGKFNLIKEPDSILKKCMRIISNGIDLQIEQEFCKKITSYYNDEIMDYNLINEELLGYLYNMKTKNINKADIVFKIFNVEMRSEKELRESLKKGILTHKGFFSYREFDFVSNDISKNIEEIFEKVFKEIKYIYEEESSLIKGNNNLEEKIDKNKSVTIFQVVTYFYKKVYEVISSKKNEYLNKYNYDSNKRILRISFGDDEKDMITRFLKVAYKSGREESFTSIIERIEVYDYFSSDYSYIMGCAAIDTLRFIDTYGLDHAESGELPHVRLAHIFGNKEKVSNEVNERSNKSVDITSDNKPDVVFYIKKLDSGRPTELENIIPMIYGVEPNIVLYCIFTGIDIFGGIFINSDGIVEWKENDANSIPKTIKYILKKHDDQNDEEYHVDNEILSSLKENGIKVIRRNQIYNTLANNLVPYCSLVGKDKKYDEYSSNNRFHVKKLFTSIAVKEHLGITYIDKTLMFSIIESEDFKKALIQDLKNIFEKASLTDWKKGTSGQNHHIVKGNTLKNILLGTLGYYSYYSYFDGTWASLFSKAYNSIFAYEERNSHIVSLILDKVENNHISRFNGELLEDFILQIHNDFLGCPKYNKGLFLTDKCRCDISNKNNSGKTCLKEILLDMYYNDSDYYSEICMDRLDKIKDKSVIVLRKTINNYTKSGTPKIDINNWLNNMYNFSDGFDSIKEKLVEYFLFNLKNKIANNNQENLKKFINANEDFRNSIIQLSKNIKENISISSKTNLGDMLAEIVKIMKLN